MKRIEHDAPRAAEALGLVERYSYLHGASGERYLFTSILDECARDYRGAVVVMTAGSRDAQRIAWIGEVDDAGLRHGAQIGSRARRMHTLVHLLARDADLRRQIICDLRNQAEHLCETRMAAE